MPNTYHIVAFHDGESIFDGAEGQEVRAGDVGSTVQEAPSGVRHCTRDEAIARAGELNARYDGSRIYYAREDVPVGQVADLQRGATLEVINGTLAEVPAE